MIKYRIAYLILIIGKPNFTIIFFTFLQLIHPLNFWTDNFLAVPIQS